MLGQGVATPDWVGRGECTGRTDDYPRYAQAADILVNYTYPLDNGHPLELVATGIDNLNRYAGYSKPVIADLEASSINGTVRPTPHQLRAEVWMSLIHGAAGIQYFCHQIEPNFSETDCLDDAPTAAALTQINAQLQELAPALNTQSFALSPVSAQPQRAGPRRAQEVGERALRLRRQHGRRCHHRRASRSPASARRPASRSSAKGETSRRANDAFEDAFEGYAVHLYRLR